MVEILESQVPGLDGSVNAKSNSLCPQAPVMSRRSHRRVLPGGYAACYASPIRAAGALRIAKDVSGREHRLIINKTGGPTA